MIGRKNLQAKTSKIDDGENFWKRRAMRRFLGWAGMVLAGLILIVVILFLVMSLWPGVGAQGADLLRGVIGDKTVAGLEMAVFQVQDTFSRWKYDLGIEKPAAAWETASTITPLQTLTPPSQGTLTPVNTAEGLPATQTWAATFASRPFATPTPAYLQPTNVPPLGTAAGEGVWSPYIQGESGHTLAFRTFLQPDPSRPYTLVAVVAFDLRHTALHFIMGTQEPASPNGPLRSGMMPEEDRIPNVLLAAFNGGFKARHGEFGAMQDGTIYLPPKYGLGTLVIYKDGSVRLGEWGKDVYMTPDIVSLRQNGPLVVQQGKINPRIYNNDPKDWGYTVNDVSPTIRTGIGLSQDGRTLYYFIGPSLSMEMLAKSMQAAGAWNGIQLDINNYWSLFVKITVVKGQLVPEPLLPKLMVAYTDRYLYDSSRDFFYVTTK